MAWEICELEVEIAQDLHPFRPRGEDLPEFVFPLLRAVLVGLPNRHQHAVLPLLEVVMERLRRLWLALWRRRRGDHALLRRARHRRRCGLWTASWPLHERLIQHHRLGV